ncbi:carbon-nitrogen hydrolase [Xylariomycetidae sp. FL2044]|nr:carbon-nitrogen hydrolase [Xylariomycetidae sp. FL2044]
MRIGCLQFAPQVGDVDNNLNRADAILNKAQPKDLDLLVLPELAFTGYNFKTLSDINPFLENTGSGISSVWARTTALKHNCTVVVGYPETTDISHRWPTSPEYYNSAIIVNEDGDTRGHYRKSHLYYTDETWALEGPGFFKGHLPGLGKVAMGICMDINPYKFEAPWHAFEFAFHALEVSANVVIVSMAWLTREDAQSFSCQPKEPDMDTLTYWVGRLEPLIRAETEDEIIVIFANRTGIEDDAVYAGTSAVIGIQHGEVTVYGLLGRGEKDLLVVDTSKPGFAKLVYRPESQEQSVDAPNAEAHEPNMNDGGRPGSLNGSDVPSVSSTEHKSVVAEASGQSDSRTSTDRVFADSGHLTSSNFGLPPAAPKESTVFPRDSWDQNISGTPDVSHFPNKGSHDTYEDRYGSPNTEHTGNYHLDSTKGVRTGSTDEDTSAEFSALLHALHDTKTEIKENINRPFSTKSRNTSRSRPQRAEDSPWADERHAHKRKTPSMAHQEVPISPLKNDNSGYAPGQSVSHFHSRDQARELRDHPRALTRDLREKTLSPNLANLDADLMVFEGSSATRTKRDSLVCHVDEDDYVVRRKDSAGRKRSIKTQEPTHHLASRSTHKTHEQPRHLSGSPRPIQKPPVPSPNHHADSVGNKAVQLPVRGVKRTDSTSTPHSVSNKVSESRLTSGVASPPAKRDFYKAPADIHHTPHQGKNKIKIASPPARKAKKDAASPTSLLRGYREPERIAEQIATIPGWLATQRRAPAHSGSSQGKVHSPGSSVAFSPGASESSPSIYAPLSSSSAVDAPMTGLTVPDDQLRTGLPPTPKAMVLPPDYGSAGGHQSVPPPPKKTAHAAVPRCWEEKNPEMDVERPRSAVW